jgi:hypothetical protein
MVSAIARALGQEQSGACRAESLRLMARCAPIGCPVSVGAGAKPRVVGAAGRACAARLCMCGAGPCFRRSLARLAGLVGHAAHFWVYMSKLSKSKSVRRAVQSGALSGAMRRVGHGQARLA